MTRQAGDLVFTGEQEIMTVGIADTEVITKGRLVSYDASGHAIAGLVTSQRAVGLHIALETKTGDGAGTLKAQVAIGNTYVYGVALNDNIKPNMLLKFGTGGKLDVHAAPANAALNAIFSDTEVETALDLVRDYYGLAVARYIMLEGEEDGASDPVTDSVIGVRLGVD